MAWSPVCLDSSSFKERIQNSRVVEGERFQDGNATHCGATCLVLGMVVGKWGNKRAVEFVVRDK
jgi:hypothetical protein